MQGAHFLAVTLVLGVFGLVLILVVVLGSVLVAILGVILVLLVH